MSPVQQRLFRPTLLLVLGFSAVGLASTPAGAQVFTKLTTANDPTNPIVLDPGAEANSYAGASWMDFDRDGLPDLFVNRRGLYRNLGGGQFVKHATGPTGDGRTRGNSWADVDNDGDLDVVVSGGTGIADPPENGSFLFRNDAGVFSKDLRGVLGDSLGNSGWGCACADYDVDGHVDFVITSAHNFTGTNPNRLLHNLGDGTFARDTGTDVTGAPDAYTVPTWSDYDMDGDPDLSIAAGPADGSVDLDYLFRNQTRQGGTPRLLRVLVAPMATDLHDGQVWNWVDIDNDGDLDLYVTNYGAVTAIANDLYRNEAGTFVRQTAAMAGPIVTDRARSLASVWADFDNDGDLDCVVTNDATSTNRFYLNNGAGVFSALALGALTTDAGPHFGACAADYDKDGDLDLFVNGTGSRKALFRNDTVPGKHWAQFALRGTVSNRAAIGARVRVKATIAGQPRWQLREVSAQNSFNGHNDLVAHFGLGDATVIDSLEVTWPSGLRERIGSLAVDSCRELVEGELSPTPLALAFEPTAGGFANGHVTVAWQASRAVPGWVDIERAELGVGSSVSGSAWRRLATRSGEGRIAFDDADVVPGRRYGYRLAWSEKTGRRFGDPVIVEVPSPVLAMTLRGPQPLRAGETAWVELSAARSGTAQLLLVDLSGRVMERAERTLAGAGVERIELDAGHRLASGAYFVRVTLDGETRQSRFVVLR